LKKKTKIINNNNNKTTTKPPTLLFTTINNLKKQKQKRESSLLTHFELHTCFKNKKYIQKQTKHIFDCDDFQGHFSRTKIGLPPPPPPPYQFYLRPTVDFLIQNEKNKNKQIGNKIA